MKVFDLHCPQDHVFEGWFGSEADFRSQMERALVECPICASTELRKGLSAPRLNLGVPPPKQAPQAAAVARCGYFGFVKDFNADGIACVYQGGKADQSLLLLAFAAADF